MQQPFCLMDGSVCSCYMHYTGFPSALHPPCFPTFSYLHLGLATLDTLPTLCTHWRLKSVEKIAECHFNPFRVEQRAFTLSKAVGFPACRDLAELRAKSTDSASLAVVWITQPEIPREVFGKVGSEYRWILPPVKACSQEPHLPLPWLKVVYKETMEISALNFSSSSLFLGCLS